MASKMIVTNACDRCGAEDDGESVEVTTITVTLGRKTRTFEACGGCLPIQPLNELMEAGRA
jgi:hypothetical protein